MWTLCAWHSCVFRFFKKEKKWKFFSFNKNSCMSFREIIKHILDVNNKCKLKTFKQMWAKLIINTNVYSQRNGAKEK